MTDFNYDTEPFSAGTVLWYQFLEPRDIAPEILAQDINISESHITDILHGKRTITPDIAVKFDQYFKIEEGFFSRLQTSINQLPHQSGLTATAN